MENIVILCPLFFLTALLYASVGFAGGSTYLALLFLFDFPHTAIPAIGLSLNLIVSAGGVYHYARACQMPLRRIGPWVLFSAPAAYAGGIIPVGHTPFLVFSAMALACAGVSLLLAKSQSVEPTSPDNSWLGIAAGLSLGTLIGFVSGLVGIGGGIFLAPLLYFLRWGKPREIAAASSFFIFFNSLFGLGGQWTKTAVLLPNLHLLLPMALAVFLGGQIGSRLGSRRFPTAWLTRGTAVLVLYVAGQIGVKALHFTFNPTVP